MPSWTVASADESTVAVISPLIGTHVLPELTDDSTGTMHSPARNKQVCEHRRGHQTRFETRQPCADVLCSGSVVSCGSDEIATRESFSDVVSKSSV